MLGFFVFCNSFPWNSCSLHMKFQFFFHLVGGFQIMEQFWWELDDLVLCMGPSIVFAKQKVENNRQLFIVLHLSLYNCFAFLVRPMIE